MTKRKLLLLAVLLVILLAFLIIIYFQFVRLPKIPIATNISSIHFGTLFSEIQKRYKIQQKKSYFYYEASDRGLSIIFSPDGHLQKLDVSIAVEEKINRYTVYHFFYDSTGECIMGEKLKTIPKNKMTDIYLKLPAYRIFEILDESPPINWVQKVHYKGDVYQILLWQILNSGTEISKNLMPEDLILPKLNNIYYEKARRQITVLHTLQEDIILNPSDIVTLDKAAAVLTMIPLRSNKNRYIGSPEYHEVTLLE